MTYRFGSINLTRWQLAVLLGTPVLVGVGIYFVNRAKSSDKKSRRRLTSSIETEDDASNAVSSESTDAKNEEPHMTPIEVANSLKNMGNACYRKGKYDEAIAFYEQAIANCPETNTTDMAIFYQNRAAAYEMLQKYADVKEDCTHSIEYNPRYAKAYFRRAKAYEATNQLRDCLDDITATCILEMFQNNSTIVYADRILQQTGREDAEKAMVNRVAILPSQGFINIYLRSFVNDPVQNFVVPLSTMAEDADGFLRARIALDKEEYYDIIPACTEEIERSESESLFKSEALLLRGTFHLLSGNFEETHQDFNEIINSDIADIAIRQYAFIRRASLFIQLEQKTLGLADYLQAEQLDPNNPDVYHQRAQVYILMDQLSEALVEFKKAVKLAPNHGMALIQKCYAEYRQSLLSQNHLRLATVIDDFRVAIEKFPTCIECYSLMAQVLTDQQQFLQADEYYAKALTLAPKHASLYVHRGILYLQWKGDVDNAVQFMNRAIEIDDKCELAYETLGTIEVQRGNLTKAIELFTMATKLAKTKAEMCHLFSLRNAAIAQVNVTTKLGIDMSTISTFAQINNQSFNPAPVNSTN
ncbi:mitochondrial import receptor subunit TOM70 isoform X2 [Teleopsis dalmanni]|nr:mitochondrial import receptor subunit TOM70 isoform X2 [Teleopsis dalmanni]